MIEMTKMAGQARNGDAVPRSMDSLIAENQMLKGTADILKQWVQGERNEVAQERAQLQVLREANEHLVLATFGAEDQKAAAETVNQHQTVFLSMLAHELRNPIAAISVANSIMMGMQLGNPRATKMAEIIGRQTTHLQRLVDDLLDVARINTGKISLQISPIALDDVIGSAIELSEAALRRRLQQIVVELPPAPLMLAGDKVRLAQLFSNLLINAGKFSLPESKISLTATALDGMLSISVKDRGIGIAPEDQTRIFDLFAQSTDASGQSVTSGLGIGLALVKSIAQMHGGSVSVASDGLGCGSEFIVVLPRLRDGSGAR